MPPDSFTDSMGQNIIRKEPIAIVGIGCRFPGGAANPQAFWRLLCQKRDAIVDVPEERWDIRKFYDPDPAKPGKTYTKQGGFLKEKIDQFDPLFFGISPREAESMDPQQRLLLEVTWEAFENAGLPQEKLRGSRAGVFIGGFMLDNMALRVGPQNRELVDTHTGTSCTMTLLANRLSYVFDLHGPSVSMDTACSSSLVATHYACQSIWNGESELAITGGVNVMLRPEFPIVMSKGKFLSPHGRCKAFDEQAAGYARGEGAGAVILKPLSKALQDGDRIYAQIRMSGVNQDGHTPGISMPNADAQEALIREVYHNAGISPAEIQYVEAHGTGTQAGDPKEAAALHAALSENRPRDSSCLVGSVKTNIGHLEAAAGIAGLIKASLCLYHENIPPNLHFEHPNPGIPFERMCIRIPTQMEAWPRTETARYAGVNSFGYGGTNAHLLLQEAPLVTETSQPEEFQWDRPCLVPVSARSEKALKDLAGKYAFYLTGKTGSETIRDFLYTVTMRRSHHQHRLSLVVESHDELREKLQLISSGDYVERMQSGICESQTPPALVFVYTGMGPQWWSMGRELMEREPVFMDTIRDCDGIFQKQAGWSILEALSSDEQESKMAQTEVAQPANFVIQVALTQLWKQRGITPAAIIGHSVGEVAAAFACGALTLQDALQVCFHRSRLQAMTAGDGAMLATGLSEMDALALLECHTGVSIAALNSPSSVTLSGDPDQLQQLSQTLQERGIFNRPLDVEVAYHSPRMEQIREELLASLRCIEPRPCECPLYSTVSGDLIQGDAINAEYWWRNVRQPVRFSAGIKSLLDAGFSHFLEIGPHPVLAHSINEIATDNQVKARVIPSLNRKSPETARMLESLGELYSVGVPVDWSTVIPTNGRLISLPNYPWQKEKYWHESMESLQDRIGLPGHIFLNNRVASPHPAWSVELNEQYFPYIKDHRVNGLVVFPGAAYVEAGLAVQRNARDARVYLLENLEFHNILAIEPEYNKLMCTEYIPTSQQFFIHSKDGQEQSEWRLHASGRLVLSNYDEHTPAIDIKELQGKFTNESSVEDMYAMLTNRGLDYGESFRNVRQLWNFDDEFLVRIDTENIINPPADNYLLHPAILDAAFHSVLSIVPGNSPYVPVSINKVIFYSSPADICWCHGIITKRTGSTIEADIYLYSNSGDVHAIIQKSFYQAITNTSPQSDDIFKKYLYKPTWEIHKDQSDARHKKINNCIVFTDESSFAKQVETVLIQNKANIIKVMHGDKYARIDDADHRIGSGNYCDYENLLSHLGAEDFSHIFYLWPHNHETTGPDISLINSECMKIIYLVKMLAKLNKEMDLIIFTKNAQFVTPQDKHINLNISPLCGMPSLIENEYPGIKCRLIDLDDDFQDHTFGDHLSLFTQPDIQALAFRKGDFYYKKLERFLPEGNKPDTVIESISTDEPVCLTQQKPGQLDSLVYRRGKRRPPQPGEVEIRVHSACLNFKDILKVYGSLPRKVMEDTYFGETIGMEVSGTIVGIGDNVQDFNIGDEIVAPIAGSFRSYATLPATYLMKVPASMEIGKYFIHIGYLTAYYGLMEIARLQANDKVLIHSASGGLGLAAIQIAKWVGAEIYATAGNEERRDYLKSLGIDYVMDSRALVFVDEIRKITDGYGVDVILNTLSGDSLQQSFSLLAPYGRFIEVGKKEIADNSGLLMNTFNRNITFAAIDIDRMHAERPELVKRVLVEIDEGFNKGYFHDIPTTSFDANDVIDAFRYMAQTRHIGKIVINFDNTTVDIPVSTEKASICRADATYLVTGGTAGFGLEVGKWLAATGAGRIVLISRSGATTDIIKQTITELQNNGVLVEVHALDVTDSEAVMKLMDEIQNSGPPLRGVIHSAMVLDDAFIEEMDEERFYRVLSPKVSGALNLYRCLKPLDLDFFIMFSSISSLVGNRGQVNYVAANYFLDEFAKFLRSEGIPATTINWGMLAESGVVTRNKGVADLLEQQGIKGLSNSMALSLLEHIIFFEQSQIGIFDVDWERWSSTNEQLANSAYFKQLISDTTGNREFDIDSKVLERIREFNALSESESHEYIALILRDGMAKILRISPEKININQNLDGLGIDSLILLELSLSIREEFGITISAMDLFKYPTLSHLTHEVTKRIHAMPPVYLN